MSRTLPTTVPTPQLRDLLRAHPHTRLIDVRTPGEFASAHIPGSSNVPMDLLREHKGELTADHDDPIVLVCASGVRADQARTVLESAGLDQLSVLDGGVTGWQADDGPIDRGSGTWAMERQVRLAAGLLVLIGVVASTRAERLKWIAGFVGGGLTFSAVSNTCAMARVLGKLPHNQVRTADPQTLLAALTDRQAPVAPSR